MNNNYLVIMAGGVGARFWPLSKTTVPKQFIDILGIGKTLIQQTLERFLPIIPIENIYIVTNEIYTNLVSEQLPMLQKHQILSEPSKRNTAPCIAYASYKIYTINPDANLVVSPADHLILKNDLFIESIRTTLNATDKNNWLMTLGIKPTRPDTGYGYIQFKDNSIEGYDANIKKVKTFTEKPTLDIAKTFIESGDFVWNSGIFVWKAENIIEAFAKYLPEINNVFKEGISKYNTKEEPEFIQNAYQICTSVSIDYGVMEKANNVYTYTSSFDWSDLGTYGSLFENMPKNADNNAIVGDNVFSYNTKNTVIHLPKDKLAVIDGLEDFIVVESNNILMICKKEHEQQIRHYVNDVKLNKGERYV